MSEQVASMQVMRRMLFGLLAVCLGFGGGVVQGQEPLTVEVDRTTLTTDETVQLTVTVNGSGDAPILPPLPDFQIVSSGSSTSITMVNGEMSVQAVYRYTLRPLTEGELRIDAITATVDGQTYSSDPIVIEVSAGTGSVPVPPAPVAPPDTLAGQDFLVEAGVDKESPYLGEQVIYTFRFYQGAQLAGRPLYERPEFTGFWSQETAQDAAPGGAQIVQQNGRAYRVVTLQTILFPTVPGRQVIDPARLELPGSFGQDGVELFTEKVVVNVRSLPQPAPPDFTGAVGQFTLSAVLDQDSVAVNDSLTLRVTLSGSGSLETVPDPAWPELDGWRRFENGFTINTRTESGANGGQRFTGSKEYEQILIPGRAGVTTLPPISYTFFNPETGQYETVSTNPLPVIVTDGAAVDATPTPLAQPAAADNSLPDSSGAPRIPPSGFSPYWAILVPLLLLLAGGGVWWWRKTAVSPETHPVHDHQYALQLLAAAHADGEDAFTAVNHVLSSYLAHRLDRPVIGLTQPALAALLRQRGLAAGLIDRVLALLAQCDAARFAPDVVGDGQELVAEARQLILDLEDDWPDAEARFPR